MNHSRTILAMLALLAITVAPTRSTLAMQDVDTTQEMVDAAIELAGPNGDQVKQAIDEAPADQQRGMRWLVARMPESDLKSLSAEFLLENSRLAHEAWRSSPWYEDVPEDIFLDAILPYASINERRDAWRGDFNERFIELVSDAGTPSEAAAILNNRIFPMVGVKYSTKRPKPDQSPYESIEAGMASCTGLSVLLIDACRSVGVPARFVGTPLWSDGSGNHSWVEIWDDGWHFTGAAEPTGDQLNKGWFTGRAAGASRDDPRNAIYATTWRRTPIRFPMIWLQDESPAHAVDVTDRYTSGASRDIPDGMARVRFRVAGDDGERVACSLAVSSDGESVFTGTTRDERFDANDHLEAILPIGGTFEVSIPGSTRTFTVERDQQLLRLQHRESPGDSRESLKALLKWINDGSPGRIQDQAFASAPLDEPAAARATRMLWKAHREMIKRERGDELEDRLIQVDGAKMPIWYTTYGRKPSDGHSLWISMHGGGGAPPKVNTSQWENQKQLYKPEEGIYLAPRAPTDTWNLWHQAHVDLLLQRLIETMIVLEDVDPDRIYIMGYSAGGDGVYQLAPRMADRWAAAAMMAGHPNDARPESLRNTAFTLHMGANDTPYNRNGVARQWEQTLAQLHENDPGGYDHWVKIHEGKGHWMEREDAAAVPWMARRSRDPRPARITWLQDDVTHDRFYWLAVDEPIGRYRIDATRTGNTIDITDKGETGIRVRLDDRMVDLEKPVTIRRNGEVVFEGVAPRTIGVIAETIRERGDPSAIHTAEIVID